MKDGIGVEHYLVTIIYIVLVTALLFCALENINAPWRAVYVSLGIITSFTIKQLLIRLEYKSKYLLYFLISADIVMTVYLSMITIGTSYRIFYYVIMYEVVFNIKKVRAFFVCIGLYALDLSVNYYRIGKVNISLFLKQELYYLPVVLLIAVVLFLVKYIIEVNLNLFETRSKLEASNVELGDAYKSLKTAYRKNEDYLIMQEKNELAREIHDTVGHTLTTALVEMEAAKILMDSSTLPDSNIQQSSQKLGAAVKQVRKGLNEVRNSVSQLNNKDVDYYKKMINIIDDVKRHTEVVIRYDIDDISRESEELKKCIFRALQEGITNSIRHGGSSAVVFKLKYEKEDLYFSLEDNGKGCGFYKKGFGLSAMEERVKDACGDMEVMTEPGEGFNIYIKFYKINNVHISN